MRLLVITLTIFVSTAHAGMYKCKDANGKTSYQSSPCRDLNNTKDFQIHENKPASASFAKQDNKTRRDAALFKKIVGKQAKAKARLGSQKRQVRRPSLKKKTKEKPQNTTASSNRIDPCDRRWRFSERQTRKCYRRQNRDTSKFKPSNLYTKGEIHMDK